MSNQMKLRMSKLFSTSAGMAALMLRVPVGLVLAAHGSQKLFAWFGGYGLQGTGQWLESIGFAPGYLMALLPPWRQRRWPRGTWSRARW